MYARSLRLPDLPLARPSQVAAVRAASPAAESAFAVVLLREGILDPDRMVQALALQSARGGRFAETLIAGGFLSEAAVMTALARHWAVRQIDPLRQLPDVALLDRMGTAPALRDGLLPWRRVSGRTLILTARPEDFARHRDRLTEIFGPVNMALTPAPLIEAAILSLRGPQIATRAETRVAAAQSCRSLGGTTHGRWAAVLGILGLMLTLLFPVPVFAALIGWGAVTMAMSTALKLAAAVAALLPKNPQAVPDSPTDLPTISVIVALYGESNIAPRLVRRLGRIDYPRDRLEVALVVEDSDTVTRAALAASGLPPWMRVIVAPAGSIRTKPRALNVALDQCAGSIIGVYDAEDAPDPGQLRVVAQRFACAPPQVACLQGILDFYNPRINWLSRCFTTEYAVWFRLILPGLARLGLPVPLGGTTLFFRRDALDALGGWDAHNVTEDADLGIRLARHGLRTELIDTVTGEEANCRALPWVKQRSRWLKGYMLTWAVHMRSPRLLLRQLGWWKFAGFQVLFLGTLSQFLLVPVIWSLWALPLGLLHPVAQSLPHGTLLALTALFLTSEAVNICLGVIGLRRAGKPVSALWVPTLHVYFPLGSLASIKALWELVRRPFYWDKTSHGHFDAGAVAPPLPGANLPLVSVSESRPRQRASVFRTPARYAA